MLNLVSLLTDQCKHSPQISHLYERFVGFQDSLDIYYKISFGYDDGGSCLVVVNPLPI